MKKYLLILTTLALLGGGCSKEEIPETTDGEGSVEFRTTTCSEVDSQTTRAQTSLPDNCKPSGNSFKLVVKGKEGTATAEYLAEYTKPNFFLTVSISIRITSLIVLFYRRLIVRETHYSA